MADPISPIAPALVLSLEVVDGVSRGLCRTFECDPAAGAREITIGRGSAEFSLAADDRAVGRGVHLRLAGPEPEGVLVWWRLRNEHRNRVFLRAETVEAALEQGDQVRFRTPGMIQFLGGGPSILIGGSEDAGRSRTRTLIERSGLGDHAARDELLAEHMDWIRNRVRQELGPALRKRVDSVDMMQEAAIRALEYGPRFVTSDPGAFRAILCRIIVNTIRDENDKQRAQKRDIARERPLQNSAICIDLPEPGGETPSQVVMKLEQGERLALALAMLEPEDREVLHLREIEGLSLREIGERLGLTEDAARMRHKRALPKLRHTLERLSRGEIDDSIGRD